MDKFRDDLLWNNILELPYFRGLLRAVEARFYQPLEFINPVLDLGCGDGHFAQVAFDINIDVGLDPYFPSLIEAKKRNKFQLLVCAEGMKLPFQANYFTSAYSNSVLEHIKPVDDVILEIYRVVKNNGSFILTVPNQNFVNHLSLARLLDKGGLNKFANGYRKIFNFISRHFHTDLYDDWLKRFMNRGFICVESWNYFSDKALWILEWGHLFGIPSWIVKRLFGKWILVQKKWNLFPVFSLLKTQYHSDQKCPKGAYSFFHLKKI